MPDVRGRRQGTRLPDGRWMVRVKGKGMAKPKAFARETLKEAQDAALAWERANLGLTIYEDPTVEELMEAFLCLYDPDDGTSTYRSYEQASRLHIVPHLGGHRLSRLRARHVAEMMLRVDIESGRRSATKAREVLRAALSWAVAEEKAATNVAKDMLLPDLSEAPEEKPALDEADVQAIYRAEEDLVFRAFWRLLAETGYRPWKEARMLLREDLTQVGGDWWIRSRKAKTPKGKKPRPISPSLAAELLSIEGDSPFIFYNYRGDAFTPSNATRHWKRTLEKAGVPDTNVYQLRHFRGTDLLDSNVPEHVAAGLMGLTDARTLKQYYARAEAKQMREAEKMIRREWEP
jgi:integrase